jgi:hypothetical protein
MSGYMKERKHPDQTCEGRIPNVKDILPELTNGEKIFQMMKKMTWL